MRRVLGAAALVILAGLSAARAEDAGDANKDANSVASPEPSPCEVPPEMMATEAVLGKVAEKVKSSHHLDVLVVGSGSSTLGGPNGAAAAYPARLEFYLGQKVPGVAAHVTTDLHQRQSAPEMVDGMAKAVHDRKPTLVVWQTGTVDALRSVDHDDFRAAITKGTAALKAAGADVILMNLQYNPRVEAVLSVSSYLDDIRMVAQEQNVPLFDRFAIMQHWNEAGYFDLSVTTSSLTLAKDVHDCVGRVLADFVVETSHLDAVDSRNQK